MAQSRIEDSDERQKRVLSNIYKDQTGLKRGLQILQFIESHPGTHLRGVMRALGLPMGALQYHLYRLEEGRAIQSIRRYTHKRYYPTLHFKDSELAVLDVLSQESEGDILLYLASNQNRSLADMAKIFKLANSTVFWHLKRLVASGLVAAHRDGHSVTYSVEVDKEELFKLAKSYHPTLWERLSDRLADSILGTGESDRVEVDEDELLGGRIRKSGDD